MWPCSVLSFECLWLWVWSHCVLSWTLFGECRYYSLIYPPEWEHLGWCSLALDGVPMGLWGSWEPGSSKFSLWHVRAGSVWVQPWGWVLVTRWDVIPDLRELIAHFWRVGCLVRRCKLPYLSPILKQFFNCISGSKQFCSSGQEVFISVMPKFFCVCLGLLWVVSCLLRYVSGCHGCLVLGWWALWSTDRWQRSADLHCTVLRTDVVQDVLNWIPQMIL